MHLTKKRKLKRNDNAPIASIMLQRIIAASNVGNILMAITVFHSIALM